MSNILDKKIITDYLTKKDLVINSQKLELCYLVWKYWFLNYHNLKLLTFDTYKNNGNLSNVLKSCINDNFIKVEKLDINYYTPKLKTFKLLEHRNTKAKIFHTLHLHQKVLYNLINLNNWKVNLSPREIIKIIDYKVVKKIDFHIVDLLVIKDNKKIAIEIELSFKKLDRHIKIYKNLVANLNNDTYDFVNIYVYVNRSLFNRWVNIINPPQLTQEQLKNNKEWYTLMNMKQAETPNHLFNVYLLNSEFHIVEKWTPTKPIKSNKTPISRN